MCGYPFAVFQKGLERPIWKPNRINGRIDAIWEFQKVYLQTQTIQINPPPLLLARIPQSYGVSDDRGQFPTVFTSSA
jgi:hypothetical protein